MIIFRSIGMAFAMFSAIPMPRLDWSEKNMRYMMCGFPVVGMLTGLLLWLFSLVCQALDFGSFVTAAGFTLIPVAVTGGIHMDGFCDTSDALASHAPCERKREILKDSHAGAFAIISLCAYFVLYFAVCAELDYSGMTVYIIALSHILSRCLSGLSVILFPSSSETGLARGFKVASEKKGSVTILIILLITVASGMCILGGAAGAVMVFAALLCDVYLYVMGRRQFGGMSGDLAGWFLQVCEVCMLACLLIVQRLVVVL